MAEEEWSVAVYDVPAEPAWIWDVVSTQTPKKGDLILVKHRYGGMAYRGPEPYVKGKLDVLTSEGADSRAKADQKPARWIDLTGPVAEGSPDYVGAVMCDHPSNVRFPNVVRIHPTSLPFFSFVPAHREDLRLEAGKPATWRYRRWCTTGIRTGHAIRPCSKISHARSRSPWPTEMRSGPGRSAGIEGPGRGCADRFGIVPVLPGFSAGMAIRTLRLRFAGLPEISSDFSSEIVRRRSRAAGIDPVEPVVADGRVSRSGSVPAKRN